MIVPYHRIARKNRKNGMFAPIFLLQNDCLQIVNKGFRGTDHHAGVVRHGFGEEGVAAHHGVFADDRLAAEDGRAGVDGGAVTHGGMALAAAVSAAAAGAECAQRHALIQLHMVADDGGLAYHDAGAVVDEEIAADLRAGVNIDTGAAVGVLRHHAGDGGHVA